jgi:serine/threonine protein kinase
LVVKDIYLQKYWQNPLIWIKNTYTGNEESLREPTMHRLASCTNKARTIIRYYGHKTYAKYFMARLYMEYAPHGDLSTLLCSHARYDGANRTFVRDENGERLTGVRIPRQALLSFFEDLAEAACSMAYGYNPINGDPKPTGDWQTIIHRDLKPDNIFLSLPRTGDVPELKIADFGISVPEQYDALENPGRMRGAGSLGWQAPEQHLLSEGVNPIYALSSATNVWGVGRIMLALLELHPEIPDEVHYGQSQKGRVTPGPELHENRKFYGEVLCDLIDECIERIPRDRPTAEDLLKSIRRARAGDPPNPDDDYVALEYDEELRWGYENEHERD